MNLSGKENFTRKYVKLTYKEHQLDCEVYLGYRIKDVSGVSGEGKSVFIAIEWSNEVEPKNGPVLVKWFATENVPIDLTGAIVYPSLDSVLAVHGHGGLTELRRVSPLHPAISSKLEIKKTMSSSWDTNLVGNDKVEKNNTDVEYDVLFKENPNLKIRYRKTFSSVFLNDAFFEISAAESSFEISFT